MGRAHFLRPESIGRGRYREPVGSIQFPLAVSPNGRFLQTAGGAPFFLLADTAWDLAINMTLAQVDTYLADRRARGFNALVLEVPEHKFTINTAPANVNGDGPFNTPGDFSTPNSAYWSHVDSVFAKIAAAGFANLIAPAYLGYAAGLEGWYANGMTSSGATKMQNYGAFFSARYAALTNLVWVVGGDYTPPESAIISALLTGLRSTGPTRLTTAHWNGSGGDYFASTLQPDSPNPNWDIQTVYSWTPEISAQINGAGTGKPVILFETHYERYSGITPQFVRGSAWATFLGDGCGYCYGNEDVWPFGATTGFGDSTDWAAHLNDAGAQGMTVLKSVLTAEAWWTFARDASHVWITAGYGTAGTAGYVPVSATPDRRTFFAYLPDANSSVTLDKSKFAAAFDLDWVDPHNGTVVSISTNTAASGSASFSRATANSAGDADWILRGKVRP